jgi:hypothetical protein
MMRQKGYPETAHENAPKKPQKKRAGVRAKNGPQRLQGVTYVV